MSVETPKSTEGTDLQNTPWQIERGGRDVLQLANSRVAFEYGPAGVIARVENETGGVDYAGPLPQATIRALRDVAASCGGGRE
jgi:hypothetical protein